MPWWQGALTSISKSQSRDDTVLPSDNGKSGFFSSRRHRLLTRARRLIQPIDAIDVDQFRNNSPARPFSAAATSPSPQPLPLPELHVLLQRDPKFASSASASASANVPLPSPEIMIKVHNDKEREGETAEATNAEAVDGYDVHKSRLVGQESRRSSENIEIHPSKTSPQKQHTKTASIGNYSSAPCSPYSSMGLSPQRNSYNMNPPIGLFQVWSAPELPHSDSHIAPNFSRYSNPKPATPSLDTSPLQSPSVTVHPLPLPPPVSMPAVTTPISPVASVSDISRPSLHSQSTPPVALHFGKNDVAGVNTTSQPSPVSPVGNIPDSIAIKSTWQKGKLIGRGTFGSVYVASNRETGALCAMKEVEILPDDSKSAECIRQLEQEIKVLSRLKHPNIVQYYGSDIVGDKFYIYLEYVYPGSINKFIHDHCGAITESVVRNFTRHILFGLAYLHGKKTIHRDIKGANLLVDAYGVVKLADFGMAKHLNGQAANLSLKGSPYWMAPELLQSKMQIDASCDIALAVDIWSLGCTIIEMMNGKPPWSEYEGAAALFKVLKETPPIPEIMSEEGKDFLQCCFRRNPAERPSATSLLDHPFVNYSNILENIDIKDSMQFLRERTTRNKPDQVPLPLETAQNNKGKLCNNLSFAAYDSFTPLRVSNAAITKHPI